MTEANFDNFDEFAEDYRTIHSDNIKTTGADSHYFAEFKPKTLAAIFQEKAFKPQSIIDVGCGDGEVAKFFVEYFPESHITGIDVSHESVKKASDRNLQRTTFKAYDGTNLPFANDSADFIFIANVLHHIRHNLHPGILSEFKRVLKPSGKLGIWEHNPLNPVTVKIVNDCVFDKDAVLIHNKNMVKLLKSQGWKNIETQYQLFFPRSGFFKPFHALEPFLSWCPLGGQYLILADK